MCEKNIQLVLGNVFKMCLWRSLGFTSDSPPPPPRFLLSSFFPRYVLLLFTLFFVPGVVMITAYGLISRELYRGIQFELSQNKETTGETRLKPRPNRERLLLLKRKKMIYLGSWCYAISNSQNFYIILFFPPRTKSFVSLPLSRKHFLLIPLHLYHTKLHFLLVVRH